MRLFVNIIFARKLKVKKPLNYLFIVYYTKLVYPFFNRMVYVTLTGPVAKKKKSTIVVISLFSIN